MHHVHKLLYVPHPPTQSAKSELQRQRTRWRQAAGEIIVWARRRKGLTQQELAAKMGLSHDTVANMESGRRKIELGDIIIAADVMEESRETLIRRILQLEN